MTATHDLARRRSTTVGFLGLGRMGEPMALRLVEHGVDLLVWNRSRDKVDILARRGARRAGSAADVFDRCDVVLMMLADDQAIDEVLGRSVTGFKVAVEGRTVVNMGTMSLTYSTALGAQPSSTVRATSRRRCRDPACPPRTASSSPCSRAIPPPWMPSRGS